MNFYKKQDCQIESFLTRGGTKLWIIWLLIGIAWLIVNALTLQWWTLRWQDESQLLEIGRVVSLPESPYFNTYLAGRRLFSNGALAMYLLHSKFGWLGMRFALLLFQLAAATLFLWWGLLQKIRETMAVGLAVLLLLEPYGLLMTRAARLEPMILCALFGCLLLLQMSRNGKGAWSVPPCRLPLFGAGFLFFIMFSVWFRSVLYFPLVGMFLLEFLFLEPWRHQKPTGKEFLLRVAHVVLWFGFGGLISAGIGLIPYYKEFGNVVETILISVHSDTSIGFRAMALAALKFCQIDFLLLLLGLTAFLAQRLWYLIIAGICFLGYCLFGKFPAAYVAVYLLIYCMMAFAVPSSPRLTRWRKWLMICGIIWFAGYSLLYPTLVFLASPSLREASDSRRLTRIAEAIPPGEKVMIECFMYQDGRARNWKMVNYYMHDNFDEMDWCILSPPRYEKFKARLDAAGYRVVRKFEAPSFRTVFPRTMMWTTCGNGYPETWILRRSAPDGESRTAD